MNVGILELLTGGPVSDPRYLMYSKMFTRQYISIMPQVVSVWSKQLGHRTSYAIYFGQRDPLSLLPDDLDLLFIATYTQNSPLAYALAKIYKRMGVRVIVGGPHAKAFPRDCLRYFDLVVQNCDKSTIAEILDGHFDPGTIISSANTAIELPLARERDAEIRHALFPKSPRAIGVVPLIASVGCPYDCSFCIDWNVNYRAFSHDRLVDDMTYVGDNFPKALVAFHDPNFAVQFDKTMDALAEISPGRRVGYLMESSLSILKPDRLKRLSETNCFAALPGIESWSDFSKKSANRTAVARQKFELVVERLQELNEHVSTIQANLLFGTDADAGLEPVELTKEFITALPNVWPAINVPIPYGGTPMTETLHRDGRIAIRLPFMFYRNPFPVMRPLNYSYIEYYKLWIDMRSRQIAASTLAARLTAKGSLTLKAMYVARTLKMFGGMDVAKAVLAEFEHDPAFQRFHAESVGPVPEFYQQRYEKTLGKFSELIPRSEREPILDPRDEIRTAPDSVLRAEPTSTAPRARAGA